MINLFSQLVNLYSDGLPTAEEIRYASNVFANDYRIKKFFHDRYNLWEIKEHEISNESSIYYLDPNDFFKNLLLNPTITESIQYESTKSDFFSCILDGSYFKNKPGLIHLALYVDEFDPLIKSVYTGRSTHKFTGIYLKIIHISNHISSRRDLVFPFSIFSISSSAQDTKAVLVIFQSCLINLFMLVSILIRYTIISAYQFVVLTTLLLIIYLGCHQFLVLTLVVLFRDIKSFQEVFYPIKELTRTPENMNLH